MLRPVFERSREQSQIQKTNGFTLLELLIVLGIIVVLAVVVIIVINPAEVLRRSRDVQRLSDLANLKKALSLYVTTVNNADLDASVASFCLAPANTNAKISYSYNGSLSGCAATVAEGSDVTSGATFSASNFCYSNANTTWSLVNDFTTTSNPIPGGTWRYGYKPTATSGTFTLALFGNASESCGAATYRSWRAVPADVPMIAVNTSGVTGLCGSWTWPSQTADMHPSATDLATARWTAPSNGTFTISGVFASMGGAGPDVTGASIVHNTTLLYNTAVNAGANASNAFNLAVTMTAGDTLDFVTDSGANGWTTQENTNVTATITLNNTAVDGTGWVPVNLTSLSGNLSPISSLPVDPINTVSSSSAPASTDFVYRYVCQQSAEGGKPSRVFELNAQLESAAFTQSDDKRVTDGGDNDNYYEVGSSLRLLGSGTNF